ncbi:hypothetical protein BKA23_1069 [Rudaeicoccus suwonensis]|uniref:Uncharacterized protein n=2 Tax=Rudaeicoccus suwonensis TaxID=657409 RepID=A0A561E9H7_9MICO|nr:hypothetical protein BKA23_1069 [Rudaeicoccus suwonensis]
MREVFGVHATHEATSGATSATYRLCGLYSALARSRHSHAAAKSGHRVCYQWDLRVRTERRTPIINAFNALAKTITITRLLIRTA